MTQGCDADDERHGTYAGWNTHAVKHEKPCQDCRDAATRYQRLRRRRQCIPTELPDERYHNLHGGVGLAVAKALRESA